MKDGKYLKSDIYKEFGIPLSTFKVYVKDISKDKKVEKHGVSTYYSKEEYEKILFVYLFRMLGYCHEDIKNILCEGISDKEILDIQIKKIEENINNQTRWLNLLKFSKKTGIELVDIFNKSRQLGLGEHSKNLSLYADIVKYANNLDQDELYNFYYINNEEYINQVRNATVKYIVSLNSEKNIDSKKLMNKLNKLVEILSKACGQSHEFIFSFINQKVNECSKNNVCQQDIANKNDLLIKRYFEINKCKSIMEYIVDAFIQYEDNGDNNNFYNIVDEIYKYIDGINFYTDKGKIKIIELLLKVITDSYFLELTNSLEHEKEFKKISLEIMKYFNKKQSS